MYVIFAPYTIQQIDEIRKTSNRWQKIDAPWETGKPVTLLFHDGYLMENCKMKHSSVKRDFPNSAIAWRYEKG